MSNKWIIGVSVLAILVLGGLFYFGYVTLPTDVASKGNMEIIFYDVDGNELGRTDTRLALFGIQQEGIEGDIHSLKVVVYFKVTTDIDYGWITTGCWLTVCTTLDTIPSDLVYTLAEHRLGAVNTDEEGSFYATYLMETLLPAAKITQAFEEHGGNMRFIARLETELGTANETTHSVEDDCFTSLKLVYVETLSLESWFGDW